MISLAPGVVHQAGNSISADLVGTFPENYQGNPDLPDPKFDFGPVVLAVTADGSSATIGPIDYTNVTAGNETGWIFDFDISGNAAAQTILQNPDAVFSLQHQTLEECAGRNGPLFCLQSAGHIYGTRRKRLVLPEPGNRGTRDCSRL